MDWVEAANQIKFKTGINAVIVVILLFFVNLFIVRQHVEKFGFLEEKAYDRSFWIRWTK